MISNRRVNRPCNSDTDCGHGYICQGNLCKIAQGFSGCRNNDDCAQGLLCNPQGTCIPGLQQPIGSPPGPTSPTTTTSCSCTTGGGKHKSTSCSCSDTSSSCSSKSKSSSSCSSKGKSSSCGCSETSSCPKHKSYTSSYDFTDTSSTTTHTYHGNQHPQDDFSDYSEINSSNITESSDDFTSIKNHIYHGKQRIATTNGPVNSIIAHDNIIYILSDNQISAISNGIIMRTIQNSIQIDQMVRLDNSKRGNIILGRYGEKLYCLDADTMNKNYWIWNPYDGLEAPLRIKHISTSHNEKYLSILHRNGSQSAINIYKFKDSSLHLVEKNDVYEPITHAFLGKNHNNILLIDEHTQTGRLGILGSRINNISPGSALKPSGHLHNVGDDISLFYNNHGHFYSKRV